MEGACCLHGIDKNCIQGLGDVTCWKDNSEDMDTDGRIKY